MQGATCPIFMTMYHEEYQVWTASTYIPPNNALHMHGMAMVAAKLLCMGLVPAVRD